MHKHGYSSQKAISKIRSKRPSINPHASFMAQLQMYEAMDYTIDTTNIQLKFCTLLFSDQHTLGPFNWNSEAWESQRGADGRVYYVNHDKQSTQWGDPRVHGHIIWVGPFNWKSEAWEAQRAADGRVYYLNHNKGSTQWADPRPHGHKNGTQGSLTISNVYYLLQTEILGFVP